MGIGSKLAAMAAYQAPAMMGAAGAYPPGQPQHGQQYPYPPGAPNQQYPPPGQQYPTPSQQYPAPPGQQYPPSQQYPPPPQAHQAPGAPPPGAYPGAPGQQYPPPPQAPHGGQPPIVPAAGHGNSQKFYQQIRNKFQEVVNGRQLQNMYPPQRLDQVAQQVTNTISIEAVAQQWRLPVEIALDLVSLALYDIVIYADDSYSMQGENWDSDLRMIMQRTASVATLFDADGISVRFMNGKADRDNVRSEADVMALFRDAKPCGLTPIGTSLKTKILDPYLQVLRGMGYDRTRVKPLMVITITDGEPQGESRDTLFKVIADTRSALSSMGLSGNEVALEFAQVGDDQKATDFLDALDNHPQVGRFVDATSNYEREAEQWSRRSNGASQMSPDLYLLKMLCGAIDNSWDSKDEVAPAGGYPPAPGGYQQPPGGYPPQQPYPGYTPPPGPYHH